MTLDSATLGFLERLNSDARMQTELQAVLEGVEDRTGTIVAWATSRGFALDRRGFEEAKKILAFALKDPGTLTERDLDSVAGGFNPQPEPPARWSTFTQQMQPLTQTLIFG